MNHLICEKQKRETGVRRLLCATLSTLVICTLVSWPINVQAATYPFNQPTIAISKPVNFLNGSFESPVCTVAGALAQSHPWYDMWHTPPQWYYYDETNVPGWNTTAVYNADLTKPAANQIQLCNSAYDSTAPNSGSQYAELNTDFASCLYQEIQTVPGTKLYWSFAHAPYRKDSVADSMNFVLRPVGYASLGGKYYAPLASEIQTVATSYSNGTTSWGAATNGANVAPQANGRWVNYSGVYTVPAGRTSTSFEFTAVSAGSPSIANGNFLDDIKFQTGASLIAEKAITNSSGQRIDGGYGTYSDIVTITMKITNWGETDAAPCVLTDTLWDGLQFVPGSGKVDGVTTANVSFNSSNSTVMANIGTGATAAAGGTIKGSKSMGTSGTTGKGQSVVVTYQAKITGTPGSTVKNQAKVTYNDKGYESLNSGGTTSYSTVDYGISDVKNLGVGPGNYTMDIRRPDGSISAAYDHTILTAENSYVNQFTIIDRELDGTVWYDSDADACIDWGSEWGAQTTVKMQKLGSDGITWTDATDWSGAALTMTTDDAGHYEFKGIPPGQYRVLADIIGNVRVNSWKSDTLPAEVVTPTDAQGFPDNDADWMETIYDGGTRWAVVQTLDKTSQAFTPTANTYYTENVDFAFVPVVSIEKTCKIISTGNTDPGSSASPVTVLYGDTIEYTLTVTNQSFWAEVSADSLAVYDFLPDGLTYVSSSDGSASLTPTVNEQYHYVEWQGLPAIAANGSYTITVTARVTKPNINIMNFAEVGQWDGMFTQSEHTYHHSKGLTLTISKLVKGDMADPLKTFIFNVTLGDNQSALLSGLGTTDSQYTYRDELSSTALSGGGTLTFGSTVAASLKHGQSVTFHDLPMGINYTITETGNFGYTTTLSVTDDTSNTGGTVNTSTVSGTSASGTLNNNNAAVDYSNSKTSVPPSGIILEFWPYLLAVLLGLGVGTGLIMRHTVTEKHNGRHEKRHHTDVHDDEGL